MLRSARAGQAEPRFQVSWWITAAAYAVPLCVLPSALWRLWALADGWPWRMPAGRAAWEPYYVTQVVGHFGAALLTIGLVLPGGEVPLAGSPEGGWTVLVQVAAAASLGAIFIFGVYAYALLNPIFRFRAAPDIPGCPSHRWTAPAPGWRSRATLGCSPGDHCWPWSPSPTTAASHTTTAPPSTAGGSTPVGRRMSRPDDATQRANSTSTRSVSAASWTPAGRPGSTASRSPVTRPH